MLPRVISALVLLVGRSLGATAPSSAKLNSTSELFGTSADGGEISILSGCDQGSCPDFNAGFDYLRIFSPHFPETVIRVLRCGSCFNHKVGLFGDGCFDFEDCEGSNTICVDQTNDRAHWELYDLGIKTCWHLDRTAVGGCECRGEPCSAFIYTPAEVACTW
jgi:hypothetical protein